MQLISINIGQEQPITLGGKSGTTGIYKQPAAGPVFVSALGLPGDAIVDSENHGGPDQAVYVYGAADYDWWSGELGHALAPGTFGDNLTISELESADFAIGDRLTIGEVMLEVTAPRIPCSTLSARMGDNQFVKRYRFAERPGLYCRVIREGYVRAGDPVSVQRHPGPTVTIREMFRNFYLPQSAEYLRRCLAAPIAVRARDEMSQKLKSIEG